MHPEQSILGETGSWRRLGMENVVVAFGYWALAHLSFLVFQSFGILPMPIWPSAAVAIVFAFYRGWWCVPGVASGTILANHFSLGGAWEYALSIALMNTIGPLVGASIIRRRVSSSIVITGLADLLVCFFALYLLPPMLTATGGIGFKYVFGLIQPSDMFGGWMKWALAHSLGTLLFATPVFAYFALRESRDKIQ